MLGDDPQVNRDLTTAFAYLLLPQVLFYGLSSVFMAILNTRNVFGPPAWAPVCNNIVAIATSLSRASFRSTQCRWATRSCSSSVSA